MAFETSFDVVIVGAGIAGGVIANELAAAGASVLLLEAGPRLQRWQIVEQFRNSRDKWDLMGSYPSTAYAPHPEYNPPNKYLVEKGPHPYRPQYIRGVGGTTWHWAAACWRLLPNDFRLRSLYGVGRDWPISYDTLEPWYLKAEVALGVSGPNSIDLGSPRSAPYPMDMLPLSWMDKRFTEVLNANGYTVVPDPAARNSRPYDDRPACCGSNNCMPICPTGAQYSGDIHALSAERNGAKLQPSSVARFIEADKTGRILAVHYTNPNGEATRATGARFVLAANGIETPKLMLMSQSDYFPRGIGNSSDMVGRNLMDHPSIGVTFLSREALWPGRGPMAMTSVVNFRDGSFRSRYASKKLHLSNAVATRSIAVDLIEKGLIGAAFDREIRERSAGELSIGSFHEQLPDPNNRVVPSGEFQDALGIPCPEIHYSIDNYVRDSAVETRQTYQEIASLMGGAEFTCSDDFYTNSHIMGATIMGADPLNSVVDADCRSHDHRNLFVAGSSVMPSGASVNCTLTIAALAFRLASLLSSEN